MALPPAAQEEPTDEVRPWTYDAALRRIIAERTGRAALVLEAERRTTELRARRARTRSTDQSGAF